MGKGVTPEKRSGVIVLHPGSGSRKKIWPLKHFLYLIRQIEHHSSAAFLFVLGPAESGEAQETFEKMASSRHILARGLSLIQLASVMEGCHGFIGNDSGISHMAAALGLPTVAIFGPTDHRVWSPRGEKVEVVRRGIPCSPCVEERFFLCKEVECLNRIEPEEVMTKARNIGIEI